MTAIVFSVLGLYLFIGSLLSLLVYIFAEPIPKTNDFLVHLWILFLWPLHIKGFAKAYMEED